MIAASVLSAIVMAAATPSPAPSIPAEDVTTPGPWGFIAFFGVAIVVVLLIIDMTRRIRRVRYRAEANEKLDAETRARAESDGGSDSPTR